MKTEKISTKLLYQILALLVLFALSVKVIQSFAQSNNFDVMCRAKAKEVANQNYRNCMFENRTTELEKLKKDFQAKMKKLKDDYEKEVARIGGKISKPKKSKQASSELAEAKQKSSATVDIEASSEPTITLKKDENPQPQLSSPSPQEDTEVLSESI
jgi:Skp family chaperone for outer membrane proteins